MQEQRASVGASDEQVGLVQSSQASRRSSQGSVKSEDQAKIEEAMQNEQSEPQNPSERNEGRSYSSQKNDDEMSVQVKHQKQQDITMGNQVIDLNRYIFNGIVELCRKQHLIDDELAHSFMVNHTVGVDKRFIELYRAGQLRQFDFQKCKINIFDHRKLTEMLVQHNPEKYLPFTKPEHPYDFVKQTQEFLREIYEYTDTRYKREWEQLVLKHYQYWWGGPQRIDPLCDPPVKFYETEQGQRIRQQKEESIRVETIEEERQRNKRINTQRTINQDLKDIAKMMNCKLYGERIKLENESDGRSSQNVADQQASNGAKSKGNKEKKVKKEKKDKKKNKKHKKDKHEKKNQQVEPKREPDSKPQGKNRQAKKK